MEEKHNLLTVAWAGTINSKPPMVGIAVKPERFSYNLIKDSGEFVVNIPPRRLMRTVDFCGVRSGANMDKFKEANLTPEPSHKVKAVRVKECPVALECRVKQVIPLGSHHYFLAEVVGVEVEEDLLDATGRLDFEKVDPLVYVHGRYHTLKPGEGFFGFSVARKVVKKRRRS
jgi:flavin reductase (DIM6/NTAB) family NADH-FMN oxidoreductase RutF